MADRSDERSAREKISSQTTAHVMQDEQTRKYLQSIKRLMTFAQRKYPSAPSMSFEFNAGGFGSDKEALLSAEQSGLDTKRLAIEGIPGSYQITSKGTVQDGWRHNDRDIRTWKSIIKGAINPITHFLT